jgi:hypothetical protein
VTISAGMASMAGFSHPVFTVLSVCACGECMWRQHQGTHLDLADDLECDLSWHLVEARGVLVTAGANNTCSDLTTCLSASIAMHTASEAPHHVPLAGPQANEQQALHTQLRAGW